MAGNNKEVNDSVGKTFWDVLFSLLTGKPLIILLTLLSVFVIFILMTVTGLIKLQINEGKLSVAINEMNTIQDPDVDRMKDDLIGKTIPGWIFEYLAEFQDFQIIEKWAGPKRIEYDANITLKSSNDTALYYANVRIIYQKTMDDKAWLFDTVRLKAFDYPNPVEVGAWLAIYPFENSTFKVDGNGPKFWIYDPCSDKTYSNNQLSALESQIVCDSLLLMSAENFPFVTRFKYTIGRL